MMANALTAARIALTLPFVFLMTRHGAPSAMLAALVLAAAIVTDVLDGLIARRRGTATARGRVFDHAADCLFVTGGLAAGAVRGAFPWILPVLVAAAFVQYVVDSYVAHRERALRTSALGRWNGILYFAPLAGDVLVRAGFHVIHPAVTALAWMLVASTVISMGQRLWTVMRASRRRPARSGEGRRDRPRR
jgi:phosphatidylglycerophosphate synthase